MINQVIGNEDGITKYVDDIKISGTTFEETLARIIKVFTLIRAHGLKLNPTKTQFFKNRADHLGFVISDKGIGKQSDKIRKLEEFEKKHTKRGKFSLSKKNDILALVGNTGLYRDFIPEYSQIVNPIYELTKGDVPVEWTEIQQRAFEKLKEEFRKDFKLQQAPKEGDLYLDTQLSPDAMNGVLFHMVNEEKRIIMFISIAFKEHQKNFTLFDHNDLEIVINRNDFKKASQAVFKEVTKSARDQRAAARAEHNERTLLDNRIEQGSTLARPSASTSAGAQDDTNPKEPLRRSTRKKITLESQDSQETTYTLGDNEDLYDDIFFDTPDSFREHVIPENSPENEHQNAQNQFETPPDSGLIDTQQTSQSQDRELEVRRTGARIQRPTSLPTGKRSDRVSAKSGPSTRSQSYDTNALGFVPNIYKTPVVQLHRLTPEEIERLKDDVSATSPDITEL
ncbi:unnamed protein product [Allacma fusca]|uniref:Reverse transcriptase domain-containing protein n=1 Tax=Allacma fusca TaxID=39272 RepID=A0A8J2JIJ0_9HEXA|nr:unnamed protein product [Allacma fusca]